MLTGESVPSSKRIEPTEANVGVGDRRCMAFSGTIVTQGLNRVLFPVRDDYSMKENKQTTKSKTQKTRFTGQARGVVVATGSNTELGHIGRLMDTVEHGKTPLARNMTIFGRRLTVVICILAAVLFCVGYWARHMALVDVFLAAVRFFSCRDCDVLRANIQKNIQTLALQWRQYRKDCLQSLRLRWRSVCSGWRRATRSFVACRPSKRSAR